MSMQPPTHSCSSSGNNSDNTGDFECNICFELAQDPIVTLCGHLFCWPCLYEWLRHHSRSHECPVCKALIEEEKLVPLYGRGKNSTDPRSKSVPGMDIPHRPTGQRPETAPPPDPNTTGFGQPGYGFMGGFGFSPFGGFAPMAQTRFGNFTLSTTLGGLFPSIFNIQLHGFPNANMYGPGSGFYHGYPNAYHSGPTHHRRYPQHGYQQQQTDATLKFLLLLIGFSVILTLIWG